MKSPSAFLVMLLIVCAASAAPARADGLQDNQPELWKDVSVRTGEPAFFVSSPDGKPQALLLLAPRRLTRAYLASDGKDFPIEDFKVDGRRVTYIGHGALPFEPAGDIYPREKTAHSIGRHIDGGHYLLFSEGSYFHNRQVCFDYVTDEQWSGPVPENQADKFSRLRELIARKAPINVVVLGDSISVGANATAFLRVYPNTPAYDRQFINRLETVSGCPVDFHNLSKGGMQSSWGLAQVPEVTRLTPNLLIVAFGMNDCSAGVSPDAYAKNIAGIVEQLRARFPAMEAVVVDGMSANPDWNGGNAKTRVAYSARLRAIAEPHTVICDVRGIWDYVVSRKGFLSVTGNGVNHPNDFGHRLYANVMIQTVLGSVD
ncbi:MAG: SGNH/GDSL hydrolase family protein [Opitutaceae bacterium]|jgi:lysophospholipase L1-like esterase